MMTYWQGANLSIPAVIIDDIDGTTSSEWVFYVMFSNNLLTTKNSQK